MRIALIAACFVALGCSGESTLPDRNGGDGDGGEGGDGEGGDGFGNSRLGDGGLSLIDGGLIVPDGGRCQVGVFCEDDAPDPDDCGSLELVGDPQTVEEPGNVLVIFDRSGSMEQDWQNQGIKWQTAGQAVIDALDPIKDKLTVGAVFFPSPDGGNNCGMWDIGCQLGGGGTCDVNPIAAADQIAFKPGADFLTEFSGAGTPKYQPVSGGRTPLTAGIRRGEEAIAGAGLTGKTSVIVITDGEPNCSWDAALTNNVVSGWAVQGIDTYVVGLPGAQGAANLLDSVAAAGGTGTHITPTNAQTLANEVQSIVMGTLVAFDSCDFELDPPAEVPEDLHLVVTEEGDDEGKDVERDLGTSGGWSVSDDGTTVTLRGNLCDSAQAGIYESITFEYGCVDLPPLPPPDPVIVE